MKINDLRAILTQQKRGAATRFARATGWLKDGVCANTEEALERYCRLNPRMKADEAVKQMGEAL